MRTVALGGWGRAVATFRLKHGDRSRALLRSGAPASIIGCMRPLAKVARAFAGYLRRHHIALLALFIALGGTSYAVAGRGSSSAGRFYACVTQAFHTLNLTSASAACPRGQYKVSWNRTGQRGARGRLGPKGSPGSAGSNGASGPQGLKGDTGATGAQGAAGPAGPQGLKGDTGATGSQGAAGPAGPQGLKGDTGATGSQGAAGPAGPQGLKGDTGATGSQGAAGPAGPQGLKGDTGATGAQGATGPQGPSGVLALAGQHCTPSGPNSDAPMAFDSSGTLACYPTAVGADCRNTSLQGSHQQLCDFRPAGSGHVNLAASDLRGANFAGMNLTGPAPPPAGRSNLGSANMRSANLQGTNLTGANLGSADLEFANLNGATLTGASLGGVNWFMATCPDGHVVTTVGGSC